MMNEKSFMRVEEVAATLDVSKSYAYKIVQKLNAELKAKGYITQIKANGQGVIPGIDRGSVLNMYFPLPPLEEQKRIVEKLEELLPMCERLK